METNVGKRIKDLRKSKKMSVDDLAKKIGKSRATVYRYENNEIEDVPYTVLIPIAKALDTTPAYLMGWEDEEDESVTIGRNIKSIRTERNISIMEMAEEIHIDYDTLVQYEKGVRKVPRNILIKIASYLQVSIDNLMGIHVGHENNTTFLTEDKELLSRYERWQKKIGYDVRFTDEEIDKLIDYAKYLISQRKEK